MDLGALARDVTAYIGPFLPYLQRIGEKAADDMADNLGKKFGEGIWGQVKALWERIKPQVDTKEMARGAVEELATHPEDPRAKGAVELQLEKIFEAAPGLAAEVSQLLETAGARATWTHLAGDGSIAQGDGAVAAGRNGISAGRDVVIGLPLPKTGGRQDCD